MAHAPPLHQAMSATDGLPGPLELLQHQLDFPGSYILIVILCAVALAASQLLACLVSTGGSYHVLELSTIGMFLCVLAFVPRSVAFIDGEYIMPIMTMAISTTSITLEVWHTGLGFRTPMVGTAVLLVVMREWRELLAELVMGTLSSQSPDIERERVGCNVLLLVAFGLLLISLVLAVRSWTLAGNAALQAFCARTGGFKGGSHRGRERRNRAKNKEFRQRALEATGQAGQSEAWSVDGQLMWIHMSCHFVQSLAHLVLALPPAGPMLVSQFYTIAVVYALLIPARLFCEVLGRVLRLPNKETAFRALLLWRLARVAHGFLLVPPVFGALVGFPAGVDSSLLNWIGEVGSGLETWWGLFAWTLATVVTAFPTGFVHASLYPLTQRQAFIRWTTEIIDLWRDGSRAEPSILLFGHMAAVGIAWWMCGNTNVTSPLGLGWLLLTGICSMQAGGIAGTKLRSWCEVARAMQLVGSGKCGEPSLEPAPPADPSGGGAEAEDAEDADDDVDVVDAAAAAAAAAAPPTPEAEPVGVTASEAETVGEAEPVGEPVCIVCEDSPQTHAFVPCGHYCVCKKCGDMTMKQSRACPLCRGPAVMLMQVYSGGRPSDMPSESDAPSP